MSLHRRLLPCCSALLLVALSSGARSAAQTPIFSDGFESGSTCRWSAPAESCQPAVVFVSRQIPPTGSIYWSVPNDMPGVGVYSRFRVAAPGKLQVREADGTLRTLVDGSDPTPTSLELIDVNAPDVSWNGEEIVFAGLPAGSYPAGPVQNPGAWRLFAIRADGTDLRQITFSDQDLDLSQFGPAAGPLAPYDDTDPAWLPDGRIVFSSTRWPSMAQYSGVRTTNLYVVDADGQNLHRITAERNGADRPLVDPLTGKVVYARWWRNHRFATDSAAEVADPNGGWQIKDGLTTDRTNHVGGPDNLWRNHWQIATIRPDGTGLGQWAGLFRGESANHFYGGAFTPAGDLIANFFPMHNMTEAAGFGGLRRYLRGAGPDFASSGYEALIGITDLAGTYVHPTNPTSFGIYVGNYAGEPAALPDGRLLLSWAEDHFQDYGLYTMDPDGSNLTLLYDAAGTTELRAKPLAPRPLPPVLGDVASPPPSQLPPGETGPYDIDGTFTFNALNVYFNGGVDVDIVDAPPVGSASTIRFFLDHQRTSPGSFPNLDWPILLGERPVAADGSVVETAPAHVPLFEQLRSADGTVPLTGSSGAAHVAGMNFGRAGTVARCVGCHAGHTMIPLPPTAGAAKWSNLAPGASVTVSSTREANQNRGVVDRRVRKGEIWRYWNSAPGQTTGQWVHLTFDVPVAVRAVRLYNPRFGDEADSSIQVHAATVRLYADAAGTQEVASLTHTGDLAVSGTDLPFADVSARSVRVEIDSVSGTFYGIQLASLAEIEVIAKGVDPGP
ncbi:MAG: hypothetical protein KDD47_01250 [Acidobacteria bacterium]|nr:hypothetical protein [Acidobacteriota bacterium]